MITEKTVRASPLLLLVVVLLAAFTALAVMRGVDAGSTGPFEGACFLVLALAMTVWTLRQRVEVRGDIVRILDLAGAEEVSVDEIEAVVRGGGRGRPQHLRLRSDRETSGRYLDLRGWPRVRRVRGSLRLPPLVPPSTVAAAIGVPCEKYPSKG